MKKLTLILITLQLFTTFVHAGPTLLTQGQPAPFSGLLFDPKEADALHDQILDLKLVKKQNELLTQESALLMQQNELSSKHIDSLSKQLVSSKSGDILSNAAYFLVGVACASLAVFAVNKASK